MKVLAPILLMIISSHICAVLIECNMVSGLGLSVLDDVHDGTSDTETYEISEDESEIDADYESNLSNAMHLISIDNQSKIRYANAYFLEILTPPPE